MSHRVVLSCNPSGTRQRWQPTTLDQLGKLEVFLEDALAESPELMGLQSRRTGIRGPFAIFKQVSMETPSGRAIAPDIILFAASGHVVVVEVKRHVNPELRDRAVIAQIIDYASSFAALTEQQCVQLFGSGGASAWTDVVTALFPDDPAPEELAQVFQERMQQGELNLVIACDKIPPGLPEVVSGIAAQSALGFELDLVEVVPFVQEISPNAEILLVPSTRLATEIVSRTAVTVTYQAGEMRPSTEIQTTTLEDIESNIKSATRRANPNARTWTLEEIESEFEANGHSVTLKLLEFCKKHSADGQVFAPGRKQNASFGFYVAGTRDGKPKRLTVFNCVANWTGIYIYLNFAEALVSDATMEEFRRRLKSIFGDEINVDLKEAGADWDAVEHQLTPFLETMLWFQSQAAASLKQT